MKLKPGVSLCQKKMEIRRIVDSEEIHVRLSHILGGVLSRESIVRLALGVRAKKIHDPWQRLNMNDWNIKKKDGSMI